MAALSWDVLQVRQDRYAAPLAKPQGNVFEGRIARLQPPADPLRYPWGNEHRDASELANVALQAVGKPFTLVHPPGLFKDGVTVTNDTGGRVIGIIESARVDGDHVVAKIRIFDAAGLEAIEDGMHEISLGYRCRTDENGFQRGTEVDHAALVPRGRCGVTCALRADELGNHADCASNEGIQMTDIDIKQDAKLTAAERHALPNHSFGIPGRQGLPLEDAAHVRDAMARFGQEHFESPAEKAGAFHRVMARAKELGIDASGFEKKWSGRLDDSDRDCECQHPGTMVADFQDVRHHATHMPDPVAVDTKDQAELQAKLDKALEDLKVATARADAAELDRDNTRKDADKLAKEIDSFKTRADAADATAAQAKADAEATIAAAKAQSKLDAENAINTEIGERVALLAEVTDILGKDVVKPSDTQRTIKVALIKHVDGDEIAAEKSDDYVNGMYVGAMKRAARATESRVEVREAVQQMREDGAAALTKTAAEREAEAKKRAAEHAASQWQRKTPN